MCRPTSIEIMNILSQNIGPRSKLDLVKIRTGKMTHVISRSNLDLDLNLLGHWCLASWAMSVSVSKYKIQ